VYDKFYNLTGMPFQLTPDSRFFFGSRGHSKAIAHLNYGLAQGEGFIIITGEVGAGKTTLVEWLRSQMDRAAFTVARRRCPKEICSASRWQASASPMTA